MLKLIGCANKNLTFFVVWQVWGLCVRVNVVLNRTVVIDSDWRFHNLCGSHLQSQSELYHVSWWYYTLVIDYYIIVLYYCIILWLLIWLTRRAQLVCDSPDSLQDETDYLYNVFSKNNYNTVIVRRNIHSNTDSNTQTNSGPVTTKTIPYIRGTSETIARILQPYRQYTRCTQTDNHFRTTTY